MRKLLIHSMIALTLIFCCLVAVSCHKGIPPAEKAAPAVSYTCDLQAGNSNKTVAVTCNRAAATPDRVCVSPGYSVIWNLSKAPKAQIGSFTPSDPTGGLINSGPAQMSGTVKSTATEGPYKYTITCGPGDIADPYVDVPRH